MLGSKALKLAGARGFKAKPPPPVRMFKAFILNTDEDIKELETFRGDPTNDKVKIYVINLTGKHLLQADEDESLRVRCNICNNSNDYERYIIQDGKLVEISKITNISKHDHEREPYPHVQSPLVLGEEYMKKWRLRSDGTPKTLQELKKQW